MPSIHGALPVPHDDLAPVVRIVTILSAALALLAASLTGVASAGTVAADRPAPPGTALDGQVPSPLLDVPLSFVENRGQTDPEVRYHGGTSDHAFFFARDRVVMSVAEGAESRFALALRFVDANPEVEPRGQDVTRARVNYVRGDDPTGWQTALPTFSAIVYPELWPGIDMMLRGDDGQLKYEFLVRPGAEPADIRLEYDGALDLTLDESGGLLIDTAVGGLRDSAPVSYQDIDGTRVPVDSQYEIETGSGTEYGFSVGGYAPGHDLVIDPALEYATLLGGSSDEDTHDTAVDANGNVVVVGRTQSTDFPRTVGSTTLNGGIMDAFVAKVNADGSGLVYATYLGGTPTPTRRGNTDPLELARSVALDGSGNAYVAGQTSSGDFPTTSGAFDTTLGVGEQTATDGFVTKLGPTGTLAYSTFLGGAAGSDDGREIAVDSSGNAYVGGSTFSSDFPTTSGAFDTVHNGGEDVFVAKLNATGSSLVYSTILGGADNELTHGLAVDDVGNAYVSGSTRSADYPSTSGAFQPSHSGGAFAELFEAFVTKVDTTGSGLAYSTFLGGTEIDHGGDLTVDADGNAYTLVATQSPTFPTTPGAYRTTFDGTSERAVVKLDAAGSDLVYSTFTDGGAGAITLDAGGNAWLAGGGGAGAPVTANGQQNCGGSDAYIAQLDAAGSSILFATYYGGTGSDGAQGIDLDSAGNVYVAGSTLSGDFPTTAGAFDRSFGGDPAVFWGDAFVLKLTAGDAPVGGPGCPSPVLSSVSLNPTSVAGGDSSTGTVTLGAAAPEGGVVVTLASSDTAVATVPDSVTVPAGSTSATFTVSTSSGGSDASVTVSATQGEVTRTAVLTVTAPAPTVSVSSLALDPLTVAGGESSTGTVTLTGAAPTSGAEVTLNSSNTAVATVPASVTVPEGSTSATFTVSTLPQDFDASSAISATYGGVTRSVILRVTPGTSTETTSFSGRVDRNRTVDHTVAVGAGTVEMNLSWTESRADLDLRVRDSSGTLVFSDTGSARPKTGSFTATAGEYRFEVTNTTRRGTNYTLAVTHALPSTSTDTTAPAVSISSPTAGSTVSGTVTVGASASDDVGVSEVRFAVDGVQIGADTTAPFSTGWNTTTVADGSRTLTATAVDAAGNTTTSATVTVTVSNGTAEPEPAVSSLALSPTSVTGGESSTGTVTLTAAPSGDAVVTLTSSDPAVATVPADVTVPAGATSATFGVTTSAVSASTSVSISAAYGGGTQSAVLTVAPPAEFPTTLDAPTLLAPADEARWEPGVSRTFDWTDVSGAASYTLQVSTSSAFTSIQSEWTVTSSQVSLSFASEGERYWRVRASDGDGNPGAWSATRAFRIKD